MKGKGSHSTSQPSETPTALLYYYWSIHWDAQHIIDLHTNNSWKNTPCSSWAQLQKDRLYTLQHKHACTKREERSHWHINQWFTLTLFIWLQCVKCSRVSLSVVQWHKSWKLVHDEINIQNHSTFGSKQNRPLKEGMRRTLWGTLGGMRKGIEYEKISFRPYWPGFHSNIHGC